MIKRADDGDLETLAKLAVLMWQSHSVGELMEEFSEIMLSGKAQFFLKCENGTPVGFAQCQLRSDYVEGAKTTPVGYLEGIFVEEGYRGKGYARELLAECESWAREKGCHEFVSDCETGNMGSLRFHEATGFAEANRIICFIKTL